MSSNTDPIPSKKRKIFDDVEQQQTSGDEKKKRRLKEELDGLQEIADKRQIDQLFEKNNYSFRVDWSLHWDSTLVSLVFIVRIGSSLHLVVFILIIRSHLSYLILFPWLNFKLESNSS